MCFQIRQEWFTAVSSDSRPPNVKCLTAHAGHKRLKKRHVRLSLGSAVLPLSYTILLEEVLLLFFRHASEAKKMADFDAILRHLHDYWSLNSWYLPLIKAHFVSPLQFSHPPGFCENILALQILGFTFSTYFFDHLSFVE